MQHVGRVGDADAFGQRDAIGPQFHDAIQFILCRVLPDGGKAFHDGMIGIDVDDLESPGAFVIVGTDPQAFAPFIGSRMAITVDRAMNHHRRDAFAMRLGNMIDKIHVGHVAKAFVMHDHVVAFGPIGLFVDAHAMVADAAALGVAALVEDGPR